jgi:Holliday junction resolvase
MSRNKSKGTAFETLIVNYLKQNGFPYAERRALAGVNDMGDITGTPGLVWECKNHKTLAMSEWLEEAEIERINANAKYGFVVAKRRGYGKPEQQYVVITLDTLVFLLQESGYSADESF